MAKKNPDLSEERKMLTATRNERREAHRKELMKQNIMKRQKFLKKQGGI